MTEKKPMVRWNAEVHRCRGVGRWRRLYLSFLLQSRPASVLEMGCGDPSFLTALSEVPRRVALDGNPDLAGLYEEAGIKFHALDFDHDDLPPGLSDLDAAVCSDVFEHLLYPLQTLQRLRGLLRQDGVLYSHVPNEFQLKKTVKIMLGTRDGVYHHGADEWNDPHLRRFTDVGYRKFLGEAFAHNVKIGDILEPRWRQVARRFGLPVPYCLELGPTYASTNDERTYEWLLATKRNLLHEKR